MTLFVALVYNWWSLFTRLSAPHQRAEAITSRPLLLHAIGRNSLRHSLFHGRGALSCLVSILTLSLTA